VSDTARLRGNTGNGKRTLQAIASITAEKVPDRCREQIAHHARRAAVKRNAALGRETHLRPKARQYFSDPDLMTDEEEEEDDW
jgi:hypothetical protein